MFRYPIALIVLLLASCATCPEKPPQLVKVPVVEYVAVPADLAAPCPVERAKSRTVEAVVSAYNANVTALETCNDRMTRIRGLTP